MHLNSFGSGQSGHVVGGPHKSSYDSRFGGNEPKMATAFESPPLLGGLVLSASKCLEKIKMFDKKEMRCFVESRTLTNE